MYRRIMVPLDGSHFAEAALPLAHSVSRRTDAPIHLVTVLEPVPPFAYGEWEAAAEEWSEDYLKNVRDRLAPGAGDRVSTALRSGHVVDALADEAAKRDVDLVVMATHGRGLLSRTWLGSMADAFIHQTDLPVLLVRPDKDEVPEVDEDRSFRRILIPLDGSDLSESAIAHALEFGGLFDAAYHLTRVVAYPMDLASPYLPHTVQMNQSLVAEAKEAAESYLEGQARAFAERGLEVSTGVIVDSQPGHGILAEAKAAECDCIAMATHGRSGLSRAILGSAADKVLRGSHTPLLLYRPGS